MFKLSRRGFMIGCSSAIAAMAGSRLSYVAFGSPEDDDLSGAAGGDLPWTSRRSSKRFRPRCAPSC